MSDRTDLKMSLIELRKSITLNKEVWENIFSTNCYAYALGLDINENNIVSAAYSPGTLSNSKFSFAGKYFFTYSNLLRALHDDFKFLGIDFKEVDPTDKNKDEEWKIALFTFPPPFTNKIIKNDEILEDYHFFRQTDSGIWYHKEGWNKAPCCIDDKEMIITDLTKCYLENGEYKKCYTLKLKR